MTLAQLAVQLAGTISGGCADEIVTGAAGYDTVREREITYVMQERYLSAAEASPALAIIAPSGMTSAVKPLITVQNPRAAFAKTLRLFDWRRLPIPGIDPSAHVAQSAAIHGRAYIGPFVSVGEGAVIGDGCVIHAHAVIGDHVEIGCGAIVYPQVTIYPRCTIGCNVILHAGVVIGADGFGFFPGAHGIEKIPHLGTVVIEDDVEIGANSAVDRATTGATTIGHGTKIDNLVHIAHNVTVGPYCIIVAQVGVAGSTTIDAGVTLAGQAGLGPHLHIGAGATIAGQAGVSKDVPAGMTVSGYPAQSHLDQLKLEASLRRVPELLKTVKALKQQVCDLEAQLHKTTEV